MMRTLRYGLTLCGLAAGMALAADDIGPDDVIVLKYGDRVYVRTWFSPTQHVVTAIDKGGYNRQINFLGARLVPQEAAMTREGCEQGILFHACGDDAAPWNLNGTYIGGNRGASDVLRVTSPAHGLTADDIGSAWTDAAGVVFYVLRIFDADDFLILSENQETGPVWKFVRRVEGNTLAARDGETTLPIVAARLTQLTPACRIVSQQYLLEGMVDFPDQLPIRCSYFDITEEYDIVCPDAVLEAVKANPGRRTDFVAEGLDAVVNNRIRYRFLPRGACVVRHQATARRDFNLGYMGFVQSAPLSPGDFTTHEYYIPKTLPFRMDGRELNFRDVQDFSVPFDNGCFFREPLGNISDPANLPDRYIQFLGMPRNGRIDRKIGYALGYSLVKGITRPEPRAMNVKQPVWIWKTRKTYPQAIDAKRGALVKAGTEFDCTAYRQYFNAAANRHATCVYGHVQGDDYVLYADYHQRVDKDTIALPSRLTGRRIEIVERTPAVTLVSGDTVPPAGIVLAVRADYGYAVLRIPMNDVGPSP